MHTERHLMITLLLVLLMLFFALLTVADILPLLPEPRGAPDLRGHA